MNTVLELQKLADDTEGKGQSVDILKTILTRLITKDSE
ncbi:class III lanthipeptide [Bacillus carboniphilus]|uniref:Class III lanthipeptide n=1 Tax=Bacillus carboniphilus TaxID=86663 RepID=A0ABY9JYD4_9BACI|nr:class III lanthipeptide [Bacillus carboniphilus]WLR42605.1 class III lanthipeptide [Bacillus carboniphilus]